MANLSSLINRFNLVKQIPIFMGLSWLEMHKIARKSVINEYKKGAVVCRQGEPADFFYCVISGRLEAYTTDSRGNKGDVDFIHRGMHFGIVSILTGENHTMIFEALNDSIILKITKNDFQEILTDIPQLGLRLSQSLSKRIRRGKHDAKSIFESTVIAIYSPEKGTGSSTYAINLALSIQNETKKNVIFINIHANYTQAQNQNQISAEETFPHWKTAPVNINEIVDGHDEILGQVIKNDLPIDLLNVSFFPNDISLKRQIGLFVSAFVGDYHYVVVDLPNHMDDIILETLTQADLVHLVTCDQPTDLESIHHVISQLESFSQKKIREDKVCVVVRSLQDTTHYSFDDINKHLGYPVHAILPTIKSTELTKRQDSRHLSFQQIDQHSEYTKTITRIAREIGGVSVGLVLGGGAALGIAHIGVLRVLEKENIPIDIITGSSMGAIIAGLWAIGKDAAEIEKIARDFEKKRNMLALLDPVLPISGLVGGRAIKYWLLKNFGGRTFSNTKIPLKIVAYDLIRREELIIESGNIVTAIRKSIAIPGVIEPILEKDRLIIDGGVLNPLPTNVFTSRRIKKIIAVNVLQSPHDVCENFILEKNAELKETQVPFTKNPWQFLKFRIARFLMRPFKHNISDIIVRTLQATEYVLAEQSAQQADVVIHPNLIGINWYELYKVEEIIKRGEEAARIALPEIKKLLETE